MRRREFLIQSALLPLAACVSRTSGTASAESPTAASRDLAAHLERAVPALLRQTSTPGAGISIIDEAKLAWRGGFGVTDAESRKPVTVDTMFEAASMSKPAFAYVVMKLCENGVMSLDTPLVQYTPDRFIQGDPRLDKITARHVLSHTSGFQNWRSSEKPLAIHFTPGERYMYSGEGYNYLQTVVTRLLRKPFDAFMSERLLEPFAMTSSGYTWAAAYDERMAKPHDPQSKLMKYNKSTAESVARYGSAGALLTTPTDYARFVAAVIEPAPRDNYHLDSKSVTEMLRPHVKLEGGMYPASWALGWQIFHNDKRDFIYHGGDNAGFHCYAVASVAGKSGIVVMTNGEGGTGLLRQVLVDEIVQSFLAR
jgi:CubicO group peptidase (beta-lactamase class C family)